MNDVEWRNNNILDLVARLGADARTYEDLLKTTPVPGRLAAFVAAEVRARSPFVWLLGRHGLVDPLNKAAAGRMVLEYDAVTADGLGHLYGLPLPVTHADVGRFNDQGDSRLLPRAAVEADPDLFALGAAARRVGETVDKTFLGVAPPAPPGHAVPYGVGNFPNRTTVSYERDADPRESWLVTLVRTAVRLQHRQGFYGPWALLVGGDGAAELDAECPRSVRWNRLDPGHHAVGKVRDTVLQLGVEHSAAGTPWIKEVLVVPHAEWAADRVALVQLTPDVVKAVRPVPPTLVPWGEGYKVATVAVPLFRTDCRGGAGVVDCRRDDAPPALTTVRWGEPGQAHERWVVKLTATAGPADGHPTKEVVTNVSATVKPVTDPVPGIPPPGALCPAPLTGGAVQVSPDWDDFMGDVKKDMAPGAPRPSDGPVEAFTARTVELTPDESWCDEPVIREEKPK